MHFTKPSPEHPDIPDDKDRKHNRECASRGASCALMVLASFLNTLATPILRAARATRLAPGGVGEEGGGGGGRRAGFAALGCV